MLYALTSAYSRKDYDNQQQGLPMQTNIGKLFSIFAWGLGIVHENAELVKQWDDLEQAKGTVLDRYGANWGVQRFSESDALYRLAIRVKILAQLSGGDTDTVIKAAAELLGVEFTDITFEDVFPAKIALYVDWLLLTEERQELIEPIAWALKRILASGVGIRLYIRTYRTYRYDLLIGHGAFIGRFYRYQPVGEDRESVLDVPVAHGGAMETELSYGPIGEDRTAMEDIRVGHAALLESGISPPVIGEDKTFQASVPVAHGGFLPPTITGAMPDSKDGGTIRHSSRGGAYMHSHIKPKRID